MNDCIQININELPQLRVIYKMKKVVLTTGCFDILHVGHIEFLKEAKQQGNILVVGINSDVSIRRLKGENRPILNEKQRSTMLAAIRYVDYLFLFSDDSVDEGIYLLNPDVFAIGEESVAMYPTEIEASKKVNSRVHIIKRLDNYSTTSIVSKLKSM